MFSDTHAPSSVVISGPGCSTRVASLLAVAGVRRVLLLTDAGLVGAGVVAPVEAALQAAGIASVRLDSIQPNPRLAEVVQARRLWTSSDAQAVLALGGGSVLDSAKVLSAALASDAPIGDVILDPDVLMRRPPPLLLVMPSTAGTGSESTTAALIKDDAGRKRVMRSQRVRPSHILLDPVLTLSVPAGMTAATGWDVAMHALGALGTTLREPQADAQAREALKLVLGHLRQAVARGDDLEARSQMLQASYLAGQAIASNGVDAIHGLCTPLESLVERPHGHMLAVTFGAVVRANLPVLYPRYAQAARQCACADGHADDAGAARALVDALEQLRQDLGLPRRLREVGIDADMLASMPDAALGSRATQINALPLTRPQIAALYRDML